MKRVFDLLFSLVALLFLWPVLIVIYLIVALTSQGGGLFKQKRVGRNGEVFEVLKFRTMYHGAEAKGQLTTGTTESRITPIGKVLRKHKLDEFPQFLNVLKGEMSIVGPRPEVPKYVGLYNEKQLGVLKVRPGLTGLASLYYAEENKLLESVSDPERVYVEQIMPAKLKLDLGYVNNHSLGLDIQIIVKTVLKVFS